MLAPGARQNGRRLREGCDREQQRNVVLIGSTGTGKSHLAVSVAGACIQNGKRGRMYYAIDLDDQQDAEPPHRRQTRTADLFCRLDMFGMGF